MFLGFDTGTSQGKDIGKSSGSRFGALFAWICRHPYVSITLLSALLLAPALFFGMPLEADDILAHRRWQFFFSRQFWSGELFPRWLPGMNDGFGSPAFFIYPPFAHFAAAILAPIFPEATQVLHRLAFSILICMAISGIGFYRWMLELLEDRRSAMVGALIYMVAPYHLVIDVYHRSALAELWAFAWAPWTFYAILLFRRRPARAACIYVLTATALIFSHAPSSLFLFIAYFLYAALVARGEGSAAVLPRVCISMLIAVLLGGIYLGTALTHTSYIDTSALFTGYFNFFNWLMFSPTRWPSAKAEYLITGTALVQVLAAILLGAGALRARENNSSIRRVIWFGVAGNLILFFLISTFSSFIWQLAFPFQKIQFPWRLLLLQSVFLALLAACCAHSAKILYSGRQEKWLTRFLCLVLAGFVLINAGLYVATRRHPSDAGVGSTETREYTLGKIENLRGLFPDGARVSLLGAQGSASVVEWRPRHIVIDVLADKPARLVLRQFNYPGWQYRAAGTSWMREAQSLSATESVIVADVPAGSERVEFLLTRTRGEQFGGIASLLGCVAFVGLLVHLRRGRGR